MKLPRGIFVKLVTVFLLIGLVPFLTIGLSTYNKAKARMTETVIEYWLVRLARESAVQLDREVQEMRSLVRSWADDQFLARVLLDQRGQTIPGQGVRTLNDFLDNRRNYRKDLDLLLLVDKDHRILAESSWTDAGHPSSERRLVGETYEMRLKDASDAAERDFISAALHPRDLARMQTQVPLSTRDWGISPLVRRARGRSQWDPAVEGYPKTPNAYSLGFASTVIDKGASGDVNRREPVGALVAIFNWSRIQGVLDQIGERFRPFGELRKDETAARYQSGYPFLFASDRDTIIGHEKRRNLGTSLSMDHSLGKFRSRMAESEHGSFQYEYPIGTRKISGFAASSPPEREGFGWYVGVGINLQEILSDVVSLRDFLIVSALIVTGLVILMAAVFSHRITEPVTRLIRYTEEVARGNLDARVDIRTHDEIAVLADSFNKMTEDLKESNRRLIKAEKDAAWKEMARQVAHEIKNPLTPIVLSAQQLRTAHADRHPAFDEILKDSVATIIDQCESLRRIASDFAAYATFPRRNVRTEAVGPMVRSAVGLYRPRVKTDVATECLIEVDDDVLVKVDRDEMRRVFLNLFNNAMEAMEKTGGTLRVLVRPAHAAPTPTVEIAVSDTGAGIPEESRARLFEPYFSTRTAGTGLGLAICKKIIEESGGTIRFESEPGKGTIFWLTLPIADPKSGDGPGGQSNASPPSA